ncbi:MAG: hypothetical protein ACI3XA_08050 [Clostridia bacterium]
MRIKVAGYVFDIKNKYPYSEQFMTDYLTDEEADEYFEITDSILDDAAKKYPKSPVYYLEYLEMYRLICNFISDRDGILMHGAVIEFQGSAYMFTATSGTGKTTHIRQWKELFGDSVTIINGDKPIIRLVDGKFIAYGTPWCGKEHYNKNTHAPLKGIVLLTRGEQNVIEKLPADKFNKALFKQVYIPKSPKTMIKVTEFVDKLFSEVPLYLLKCNISVQAAQTACDAITKENG